MTVNVTWEAAALERIKKIPFFIRGFAKKKLENAAIERGESVVSVKLLEEIKKQEMG